MPRLTTIVPSLFAFINLLPSSLSAPAPTRTTTSSSPFSTTLWPAPQPITGNSTAEWGGVHNHDPSVILGPDGFYYVFSTHNGLAIGRSETPGSLSGYWQHIGAVFPNLASIINNPGSTDPWAPDVHLVDGVYHCYYAVSQFGSQNSVIGLATSTTLLPGSWTDHGGVLGPSGPTAAFPLDITNAIDPNLFVDPVSGAKLLSYGSFWADIWQFEVAGDGLRNTSLGAYGLTAPVWASFDPASPQAEEGSYMSYSAETGWYYQWFSHGICCGFDPSDLPAPGLEYSIRVGRATSPRGPFVDMDGIALTSGGGYIVYGSHDVIYAPGGQGVLSGYNGRDVLYYHYINTTYDPSYADGQKLLGWDYINYVSGWPMLSYD